MIKALIETVLLCLGGVNVNSITPSFNNDIQNRIETSQQTSEQIYNYNLTVSPEYQQSYKTSNWQNLASSTVYKRRLQKNVGQATNNYMAMYDTEYRQILVSKTTPNNQNKMIQLCYTMNFIKIAKYLSTETASATFNFTWYFPITGLNYYRMYDRAVIINKETYEQYNNITNLNTLFTNAYTFIEQVKQENIKTEFANYETDPDEVLLETYNFNFTVDFPNETEIEEMYLLVGTYQYTTLPLDTATEEDINLIIFGDAIGQITTTSVNLVGTGTRTYNIYEVVDIPNLMYTVLTMPFAFISQAFAPLTLFPNTPYQVNIGNLIMVLLALFVLIFIIKKVMKK